MPNFSSQTLTLPDGTNIFFTDTGPHPITHDYTTVVIVHGTGFNGHGFELLHDHAHREGLRLVVINRRHYPGSSSYTPEEAAALKDDAYIFDHLSRCLTQFLVAFVEKSSIPPVNGEGKGGLAVLGWSIGCSMIVSLLGAPGAMPAATHAFLLPYLRNLILYGMCLLHRCRAAVNMLEDPPTFPFGYESSAWPVTAYSPFSDPELNTFEAMGKGFREWVASYYEVPPANWTGLIEDLRPQVKSTDTMTSWSDDQLEILYTPAPAMVADFPLFEPAMEPYAREVARRCLYDEDLARTFFPNVHVTYISCGRSIWNCVWTAYESQRIYNEKVEDGKQVRKTFFLPNKEANHFFHCTDPQGFLTAIRDGLNSGY